MRVRGVRQHSVPSQSHARQGAPHPRATVVANSACVSPLLPTPHSTAEDCIQDEHECIQPPYWHARHIRTHRRTDTRTYCTCAAIRCCRFSLYSLCSVDSVANGYMWLPLETKGEAPSARWRHSASVVQNEGGEPGPAAVRAMTSLTVLLYIGEEVLVVLGGRSPRGEVLSDCHQLHLPTLSWSKVSQHHTEHRVR